MKSPRVVVVVLTWNHYDLTAQCLRSVTLQDFREFEIVVVDNDSADDTVNRVRAEFPEVDLIVNGRNVGFAEGNNAGITMGFDRGADYVLLLNNDTMVERSMLSELVNFADGHPAAGMASPLVLCMDEPDLLFSAGGFIQWRAGVTRHRGLFQLLSRYSDVQFPELVDFCSGCCILVRRELAERAGRLAPRYYLNFEDVEWAVRAQAHGFETWLVPSARVWHKVSASLGHGSPTDTYYSTRNALRFFSENGPAETRWLAVTRILARTARTTAAWTIKPHYRRNGYARRRTANLYAVRDFMAGRDGKMGDDVARAIGAL